MMSPGRDPSLADNFWHLVADLFVRDRRKLWPVRLIRCAL
jgi:hypothetical protein